MKRKLDVSQPKLTSRVIVGLVSTGPYEMLKISGNPLIRIMMESGLKPTIFVEVRLSRE